MIKIVTYFLFKFLKLLSLGSEASIHNGKKCAVLSEHKIHLIYENHATSFFFHHKPAFYTDILFFFPLLFQHCFSEIIIEHAESNVLYLIFIHFLPTFLAKSRFFTIRYFYLGLCPWKIQGDPIRYIKYTKLSLMVIHNRIMIKLVTHR